MVEKEILVHSIMYWNTFERIGKSVTDFLNDCKDNHLAVTTLNIKAGEVTKAFVVNTDSSRAEIKLPERYEDTNQ